MTNEKWKMIPLFRNLNAPKGILRATQTVIENELLAKGFAGFEVEVCLEKFMYS